MNSSSSGTNAKFISFTRPWYQPTTLAQDQLDPTGYKLPTGFQQYYLPSTRTNSVAQLHPASSSLEASRPPPGPNSHSKSRSTPPYILRNDTPEYIPRVVSIRAGEAPADYLQDSSAVRPTPPTVTPARRTPLRTPRSIVELTEVAEQSLGNVLPSITWVRMAEDARREAESFYEQGEFESAFIEFTRAVTILRDKIPTPDDRSPLTSTGRYHISAVSYLYSLAHLLPLVSVYRLIPFTITMSMP